MSAKALIVLGAAAFALVNSAMAGNFEFGASSKPFTIAQQNQNPTNDPDVQRGINERNEQERQRKIQECYDQRTAQMNPKPSGADAADLRRECESITPYAGIRG